MKQASITLLGIPDSIQMDAQTKLFIASFGTLCIQLPGLTDAPDTTTALEVKATLFQGVWTATTFDVFCATNAIAEKSEILLRQVASESSPKVNFDSKQNHIAKKITHTSIGFIHDEEKANTDEKTLTTPLMKPAVADESQPLHEPVITTPSSSDTQAPQAPSPTSNKNVSRFPSRENSLKGTSAFPSSTRPHPASVPYGPQLKNAGSGAMTSDPAPTTPFKPSMHAANVNQNSAQKTNQLEKSSRPQFNINLDQDFDIPF